MLMSMSQSQHTKRSWDANVGRLMFACDQTVGTENDVLNDMGLHDGY
jgi:hypothetical protein